MEDTKIWKPVIGYEELYEVSSLGDIRGLSRDFTTSSGRRHVVPSRVLKNQKVPGGYLVVYLYKDKVRYTASVHREVAKAFITNPENKPEVNHKDGDKENNVISNLEWVTSQENTLHAYKEGLLDNVGEVHYRCKFSDEILIKALLEVKKGRACKTVAKELGITYKNLHSVVKGKSRKYLQKYIK